LLVIGCSVQEEVSEVQEVVDEIITEADAIVEELDLEEVVEDSIEETVVEEEPLTEDGLVLHLALEEGSEGVVGESMYFDGSSSYDLPMDGVDSLDEGTIMFWFKFESLLDSQTVMPLFYYGNDASDEDNLFVIEVGHFVEGGSGSDPDSSNIKLYIIWVRDNQEPFLCFDSKENLNEGEWYHYAAVVSENGNTGYLNGVELTNRNYNFGSSSDSDFLSDVTDKSNMMLGYGRSSYMLGQDFMYFKGYMDEFKVYDKALSGDEISELM
jgi:hypothetical protein